MRESLVDILEYFFEHCRRHKAETVEVVEVDFSSMASDMLEAGFHPHEVTFTVNWLSDLKEIQHSHAKLTPPSSQSFRLFAAPELAKMSKPAIRYVLELESAKLISAFTREIIFDRAFDSEEETVNLPTMKWISMMVLLNQSESPEILEQVSELVFDESETVH